MYAVYDFLDRYCNVRWLTPTEFGTDCPRQVTLTIAGGGLQREPFMKNRFALHTKIDCPFAFYPGGSEYYDECTGLWSPGSGGRKKWEAAAYPELHKRFDGHGYVIAKRGWNMLFRLRRREGGEICFGNHSLLSFYPRFWAEEKADLGVGPEEAGGGE